MLNLMFAQSKHLYRTTNSFDWFTYTVEMLRQADAR